VKTTTRELLLLLSCFLCLIATSANAQNKSILRGSATEQVTEPDRERIRCDARSKAYQKQDCDKTCTDECKQIGTALSECDPPRLVACTQ
jgi:hypothetical protein